MEYTVKGAETMKITAYTKVANEGWVVYAFDVEHPAEGIDPSDFSISVKQRETVRENVSRVLEVKEIPGGVRVEVEPVSFLGFNLKGNGPAAKIDFSREDVSETKTEWADLFDAKNENGVHYRLYTPDAAGPRPLVLFLHGGGECGTDNWMQMVATLGAARLAEDYPDFFVMAPQAPRGLFNPQDANFRMPRTFAESDIRGETGWHRKYLSSICDIIRSMIADGKVNPKRVYVTGLSMGGAGTLRALSVGSDLFAAAVPICPTMTPETYGILCGLVDTKLWIATAYVDHTIYRHKYIVDGILKLRDAGNNNAHLTLYSPEDLEKYGLSTDPDMPLVQKFSDNHASWILVYNNEEGIMDWLMSQTK
jgi:predicted peptidase